MKPEEKVANNIDEKVIQSEQQEIVISPFVKNGFSNALENLSEPISSANYIPYQLKKRRKKKKRKRLSI
jgi:ABC-type transporter lipoprotein component MlaA